MARNRPMRTERAHLNEIIETALEISSYGLTSSGAEIELLLDQELANNGLDLEYEYGIYSRGLPTKVKSRRFKFAETQLYQAPVFKSSEGKSDFSLLLSFPKKKKFLLSSFIK